MPTVRTLFGFVVVKQRECLPIPLRVISLTLGQIYHCRNVNEESLHYNDVIMSANASPITGVSIVCSTVGSDADQRKRQNSASLAFVQEIYRWPVHKRPVTRKMCPFDDVITGKHGHIHCINPRPTIMNTNTKLLKHNKVMCCITWLKYYTFGLNAQLITVMSHEHHGVSIHHGDLTACSK